MFAVPWHEIFVPEVSPVELFVRGTAIYLLLFLALRFFLKRNTGEIGVADLLIVVLLSEVSQQALVGETQSVTEAAMLGAVVLAWSYLVNWLSYRFPALKYLTGGKEMALVRNGRIVRENMHREMMTREELMAQLRQHGIDRLDLVKAAFLEGDGTISVIRVDDAEVDEPDKKSKAA